MQLSRAWRRPGPRLRPLLSAASCSLVYGTAQGQGQLGEAELSSAVMVYAESAGRVALIEPVARARWQSAEEESVELQLVVDTLTGATPNGVPAAGVAQTFTTPSGRGSYTAQAGETPLDDTFRDTRAALSATWERPWDRATRYRLSANLSAEYDYASLGLGLGARRDLNNRHTTLDLSLGLAQEQVRPVGGKPEAFAAMAPAGSPQPKGGDDEKQVVDLLVGLTQVISRRTLMQWNYSLTHQSGYLNDPYKLVSEIDPASGLPTGTYRYERRPDRRARHALYWKTAHHFERDVVHLAYRYYWDDWGLDSHTVDVRHRLQLSPSSYLQPHLRWYRQQAADFYRPSLPATGRLPEFASGDYRLGAFDGLTLGLKFAVRTGSDGEFSLRAEWLEQRGDPSPAEAVGDQREQNLFPSLNAVMLQVGYSLSW